MASAYVNNLIKRVLDASFGNTWEEAVLEWEIIDCEEDESCTSVCVCGKENIRYLYTIHNRETGCRIFPVGSSCIQKFQREDLSERVAVLEEMFRLYNAIRHGERIELSSEFFSRKLLYALYEDGAFSPSAYNDYNEYNDYKFLLDMFNKRVKSDITLRQRSKIRGLIAYSIRPYLVAHLKRKERSFLS
jgi:hypothetical protein